jgi:hypothetical protein
VDFGRTSLGTNPGPGLALTVDVPVTGLGLASLSGRLVIGGQWGAPNRTWNQGPNTYTDVPNSQGDQLVFRVTQNGVTKVIFSGTFDNQSQANNSAALAQKGYNGESLFKLVEFANGGDARGFVNDGQAAVVGSSRANLASTYTFNLPVALQPGPATIEVFGVGSFAGVTSLGAPAQQLNLEFFGLDDLQLQFLMTPEPGSIALFGLA